MPTNLNKQDVDNITGLQYILGNHPFVNYNIYKNNQEVNNFFNSYVNSQGFNRILNNQENWWKQRHPYRKLWQSPKTKYVRDYYTEFQKYTPNQYIIGGMPIELSRSITRYDQPNRPIYQGRDILMGTDTTYYNMPFNFVQGHEYSHGKQPIVFNGWGGAQKEALDQNHNTKPGHDSKDDEKLADVQGLKYLFYKEGIYDVRKNKNINIKQVQKLRNKYPNLRPFKQMNDRQIQFQINNVAFTGKVTKQNFA